MTRDVLVGISGLHTVEGADVDEVEVFCPGRYYFRNGKHYVEYEETEESSGEIIKSRMILQDGRMELTRRGSLNAKMIFEENRKNTSLYETKFVSLMAGIDVTDMAVTESENLIELSISYGLELNCEHISDCHIRIRIMAKDSGVFRLT